jgi:uncharacterized membrane protein
MDSVLDTVGGLPVHPLVVHAVVVLVPLSALGAVLMVVWRSFSRRYAPLVTIIAAIAAGSAVVAKEAGERLATRVSAPPAHVDQGSVLPAIAIGLFLLIGIFWLVDRGIPMNRPRPLWLTLIGVLLVIVSVFAVYWTFLVGHSGAEGAWTTLLRLPK